MLVISKQLSKQRHVPRTKQNIWYVRDTELKKTVHGPATHSSCTKFIVDKSK